MKRFAILFPDGTAVNHNTIFTCKGERVYLDTELKICRFIKQHWCKHVRVKSFQQWADEMNEDPDYESNDFDKDSALDNLCSLYTLNINGKHVNLYDMFKSIKLKTE